jgi:chaperonin cofactor prefoldin
MDAKGEETPVKKESMADMWSKSAETIEKIKSEAKYMKSDDESPKEKVGETLVGTKKTKVETEPKVDYQK